ncbi:hypothetical protein C1646_778249 [Rhizophagus diaphanus]|nr:hypothetical protein C1646_778249 [Rhizophagus diaphanus] [Rhizophagus sp. MUCL 43196]
MVFQHQMPFNLYENKNDENQINSPIKLFEPGGVLNSDEGIFKSLEMYKKDFELTSEQYLDVVADEAIF